MIDATRAADARLEPDTTETAFKVWLRRLVTGAAELTAFDTGQVDAVMDRVTSSAILLPEAQSAVRGANRIVLSALDGLPAEVCVLDSTGTVVMTNKAWRAGAIAHARVLRPGSTGATQEVHRPGDEDAPNG